MVGREGRDAVNGMCCVAPLLLSVMALALVAQGVIQYGTHPPAGEGLQAHLFQVLMLAQIPLIAVFAATADWRARARSLRLLAAQLGGWFAALGSVAVWEWFAAV